MRIAVDAHRHLRGPYTAAAGLILALIERPGAGRAAMARLPVLLPIVPELRERFAVPEKVEHSLTFTRAGNWPKWTARTAHGICDFVIECAGRTALAIEFSNWTTAGTLDREFVAILARRAPRIAISFQQAGRRHAEPPALAETAKRYLELAWYEAAIDAGHRALIARAPEMPAGPVCEAVRAMVFGHMLLGRFDAVDALAADWLARSTDPTVLAHICYAKAIMDARLRDPASHDLKAARQWIERAATHSDAMPLGRGRAVNLSFLKNTLALIEMRQGNIAEARHLLDLAMATLERDAPEAFATEGAVLLQNSAKLWAKQGKPAKARADLDRLLALEPGNGTARADRARMKAEEGDIAGALEDLDQAIAWEPPSPDFHLQRGLLHFEAEDYASAIFDAKRALMIDPQSAQARCLFGLARLRQGMTRAAHRHFSTATASEPELADGWANRAAALVKLGRPRAALADLEHALTLRADPVIARNRERVLAILHGQPLGEQLRSARAAA